MIHVGLFLHLFVDCLPFDPLGGFQGLLGRIEAILQRGGTLRLHDHQFSAVSIVGPLALWRSVRSLVSKARVAAAWLAVGLGLGWGGGGG